MQLWCLKGLLVERVVYLEKSIFIYPLKDTFVDSSNKEENLSGEKHYFLGFFKKATKYRVLLEYDISGIDKDSEIIDAKLELYCIRNDCIGKDTIFSVHPISSDWDAKTVNYINQPSFDNSQKVQFNANFSLWEYISFDLTEYVKKWLLAPEENHGIIIKAENEEDEESLIGIASQCANNPEWRPRLVVKVSAPDKRMSLNTPPRVAILTPQFYQLDSDRCLFGGGERYLIDLAKLLKRLGYQVDVFQPTNTGVWKRTYDGVAIYGISEGGVDRDFFIELNKTFIRTARDYDYHIYFNLDTIFPYVFPGSICISHGVWWDSDERDWWRTGPWYGRMYRGLNDVDVLVSVDTNTINWINAVMPDLKCKRVYIPNYVDLNVFKPDENGTLNKDHIKILYPRRLCEARGWAVSKELAVELTREFDNVTFSFVGRGGTESIEKYMKIFSSRHPRIEYTWYEMNEMHRAYKGVDIVLIPSLYSEGTSLSLLEAMACGKPVVAGLVGGLTDLILQGYNGYLIQINKENLKNAVVELINNPDLRKTMGENACAVAQKFSKEVWEERWKKVILEQFPI